VRVAIYAVKSVARALDPVWRRKASGRCGWKAISIPRKLAGNTTRWKASRIVPPFSLSGRGFTPHGGGRWDDPGHAGESDSERSRGRAGRRLPVGLESNRWCPRTTRTSEDGTISVKAPPAVATDDQARGVSIQGAVRRRRVACSDTVPADLRGSWGIGCIGIGSAEAGVSE
jgi:hypothetical protein